MLDLYSVTSPCFATPISHQITFSFIIKHKFTKKEKERKQWKRGKTLWHLLTIILLIGSIITRKNEPLESKRIQLFATHVFYVWGFICKSNKAFLANFKNWMYGLPTGSHQRLSFNRGEKANKMLPPTLVICHITKMTFVS